MECNTIRTRQLTLETFSRDFLIDGVGVFYIINLEDLTYNLYNNLCREYTCELRCYKILVIKFEVDHE